MTLRCLGVNFTEMLTFLIGCPDLFDPPQFSEVRVASFNQESILEQIFAAFNLCYHYGILLEAQINSR